MPSLGETGSDPFADFIAAEQGKREGERSSNRVAKKLKLADQNSKLSTNHGQQREVAENAEDLKIQLDEKTAECATLKSQLAELQLASVSAVQSLNKNQGNVCKVSSTVIVNLPFELLKDGPEKCNSGKHSKCNRIILY